MFGRVFARAYLNAFLVLLAGLWGLGTPRADAADTICDDYRTNSPLMYELFCHGGSSSKPAGANSTFSDSFNINAASLPTEPSSYGLEMIGSRLRNNNDIWSPTFSLVKGFHRFGTGISTSSNSTFYGNDVVQRANGAPLVDSFKPHETAKGHITDLNLGTSFAFLQSKALSLQLGLSARYNKTTNKWGGGPAVVLIWPNLTLGAGLTREKVSNSLDWIEFLSLFASKRISVFEFEYTFLKNSGGYSLHPVHILTIGLNIRRLLLTGAARRLNYLRTQGEVTQYYFGAQYLFSKSVSAGVLYNYIPGANSVGFQYFL